MLEEGMKAEKVELTAEESQYIETRKLNREEVCAAYDIPPPVVHILDRATFSNITENLRSVYRDTQAPRLNMFESVLENDLRAAIARQPDQCERALGRLGCGLGVVMWLAQGLTVGAVVVCSALP